MPLGEIFFEYFFNVEPKGFINRFKPFGYVLMYSGFA